uniref:Uncharacterized protein n=1 Tax=viral metagenome TaxID=1070528 RepID=A0A6M3KWV0_9ZZZZ
MPKKATMEIAYKHTTMLLYASYAHNDNQDAARCNYAHEGYDAGYAHIATMSKREAHNASYDAA